MYYKIVAKRWFQRTYGNTYHSVYVAKCEGEGKDFKETCIGYIPFRYGYDEHYYQTAFEIMEKAGLFDSYGAFRDDIKAHRDQYAIFVSDVSRKRDL